MKHLFFAFAVILFASCKKDKAPADPASVFKKNLVTLTAPAQTDWNMFYANDRKLISFANNNMKVSYKPGVPFSAKKTESGFVYEYKNAVQDAQGRITKLERHSSGALVATQEFKYNPEGFLSEQIIKSNNLNYFVKVVYEYQAGNLTAMSTYEGGSKTGVFVFEYTNLENPIQIDLFDFKGIQFVTDTQFGRQSKNLVKNAKLLATNGQVFASIDLTYAMDTEGYIKTITHSLSGQSSVVFTCTFQ